MMRLLGKQLWLTPHLFGISSSSELAHITEFSRQLKLSYVCASNGLLTMISGNISEVHSEVSWPPCTEAEETALLWMALKAGLRSLSPEHVGGTQQSWAMARLAGGLLRLNYCSSGPCHLLSSWKGFSHEPLSLQNMHEKIGNHNEKGEQAVGAGVQRGLVLLSLPQGKLVCRRPPQWTSPWLP